MGELLQKVSCFITRQRNNTTELLLFEHPNAGIQIPAGTVEIGESFSDAALREAWEETGISNLQIKEHIGYIETNLPESKFAIIRKTKVFSRPDFTSFDWAEFRRGIWVNDCSKAENGFIHVSYEEEDRYPNPNYITYKIMGWVPQECLSRKLERHFFHLISDNNEENSWLHFSDSHNFRLFWSPISKLPQIVEPQNTWLDYVVNVVKYDFNSI